MLLVGLAGCDAGPAAPTGAGADTVDGGITVPDTASPSDTASGSDTTSGPDAEPVPTGPVFEIGTNVTGANTPDSFSPLHNGDELVVELGFQGLWMVVLAFRTRNIFQGDLTIITRIYIDEEPLGELGMGKQKLHPGGNDLDYYYNLFLVVMDPTSAGASADITLLVTDDHGARVDETLQVQLTGGAAR